MDFLYYFDFLRAYPRDYAAMTSAFNSSGGSTSGTSGTIGTSGASAGNGKPPVVRVTTAAASAAASVSIPASSTPASAGEIAEKMV